MATATITSKGQTTIPKPVRDSLRLKTGDRVEFVVQGDSTALMIPATVHVAELKGALVRSKRALSVAELKDIVRRHAVRKAGRRAR